MKRSGWAWLAISLLFATLAAHAETRAQYGGTLHVTMRAAPTTLDPADDGTPDSFARRGLSSLLFDTLVTLDENGRGQPGLAESWQAGRGNQRWQFRLRHDVKFSDGTPLSPEIAAASLRSANPDWKVSVEAGSVIIERDSTDLELLAELAMPRNAIVKRDAASGVSGTGPFHVVEWQPGKRVTLAADEDHWRGRPFLDAIEIEMGRSFRDQMTALELGKADLVEVAAEQTHHMSQEGRGLAGSGPIELLALVFNRDASSADEKLLRQALGFSVERGSIRSVLLQGAGQPAASLLPTWMSGYGFAFHADADLGRARQLREQVHGAANWTVRYDGNDALGRVVAERIALNAKDAGLSLQPTPATAASDLRLARIPLASADPWIALERLVTEAGLPPAKVKGASAEELYAAEQAFLATNKIIPLFHLPVSWASAARVHHWSLRTDATLNLADAWVENAKP